MTTQAPAQPATSKPYRWVRPEILLAISGLGLVVFSQSLRQADFNRPPLVSLTLLLLGALLFFLAFLSVQRGELLPWAQRPLLAVSEWLGIRLDQLFLLTASLVLSMVASTAAGLDRLMIRPWLAILAWLGAMTAVLLGGWTSIHSFWRKIPWDALCWALLLIAIALPLRVVNTAQIPVVLSGDEANAGLSAIEFLKGNMNNPFGVAYFSFPSLFSWFQSIAIRWAGQSAEALRVPAGIVGALTVGGVYLFARAAYNHRVGLFAGIVLAGLHFHINFSRIGLQNVYDGFIFVWTLGFLWYGWKGDRRWAFLLAGLGLGFSQYLYASGRALLAMIPLWLILQAVLDFSAFKRRLPDVLVMTVTALVVLLPLGWFYANRPNEYMAPLNRATILGPWLDNEIARSGKPAVAILATQILNGLRAYTDTPLRAWYEPGVPMLRSYEAAFFLLGSGLLLFRWRENQSWLLLLWLALFGLMGGLSDNAPAAQRYPGAAPAAAMVVGLAIAEVTSLGEKLWPRIRRGVVFAALVVVLLMAVDDARFYFLQYTPSSTFGGDNTLVAQVLANDLRQRQGDWQVLFFGQPRMGYRSIATLPYLAPDVAYVDVNQPWGSADNPQLGSQNLAFVFLPDHEADLAAVQQQFPQGKLSNVPGRKGETLYYLYDVVTSSSATWLSP